MGLNTESSAALVFLILYDILFGILLIGYLTGRIKLRSRYTVILFHVAVRLASQGTGLAFGIVGYANTNLLVAYFILGAEGYFTLVICTYRFLISWQYHNSASHDSWLEPRHPPGTPLWKKFFQSFALFGSKRRPMSIIHNLLTFANAVIIAGGSTLSNSFQDPASFYRQLKKAKAMRASGQAVFLAINIFLLCCILRAIRQRRKENPTSAVHPTLCILLAVWPLLFVRGVYGVLAGLVPGFNYFNPANYTENGLSDSFVISEYILGTTMEWTSCALLMVTYVTSRGDPKKGDLESWNDVGKEAQDASGTQSATS